MKAPDGSEWSGWKGEREARGSIRIPAGMGVDLEIKASAGGDLSFLAGLQPGDLEGIKLGGPWQYLQATQLDYLVDLLARDPRLAIALEYTWQDSEEIQQSYIELLAAHATSVEVKDPSDWALRQLASAKEMRSLVLQWRGYPSITDTGLEALRDLRALETLRLGGAERITDVGVKVLAGLETLKTLDLSHSSITGSGLAALRELDLCLLSLKGCSRVDDAGMTHLADLRSLEQLDLSQTSITDQGLFRLQPVLPSLTWLGLASTRVTAIGPSALWSAKKLVHLGLGGLGIPDSALEQLGTLPELRSLELWRSNITDSGLETLTTMTQLARLSIDGPAISKEALHMLEVRLPLCSINSPVGEFR